MKKKKQKAWLRMDAESAQILRQPTAQEKKLNRTIRKGLRYQTAQPLLYAPISLLLGFGPVRNDNSQKRQVPAEGVQA